MRNGIADLSRLIAAFGIVVFHAGAPGASIGYAALPLFTLYMAHYAKEPRFWFFFKIWICWSAVYFAAKLADIFLFGSTFGEEFKPWMIVTGPAIHLWFLSFAAVATFAVEPIRRYISPVPAFLIALGAFMALSTFQLPVPFAQWLFVVPALVFGSLLGKTWALPLAILVCCAAWLAGWHSGLLQFAVALGVVSLCLRVEIPSNGFTDWARDASLIIYLAHPLVAAVVARVGVTEPLMLALACIVLSSLLMAYRWIPLYSNPDY